MTISTSEPYAHTGEGRALTLQIALTVLISPRYLISERTCIFVFSTSNGCVANVASAPADAADTELTAAEVEMGIGRPAAFGAEDTAFAGCMVRLRHEAVMDVLTHGILDVLVEHYEYARVRRVTEGGRNCASEDLGGTGTHDAYKRLR